MQLITFLLNTVAILALITGATVMFGVEKKLRVRGIWFFLATLGAAIWSTAIATFLTLPETAASFAPTLIIGIVAGIALTDVALLGYTAWPTRHGKILTISFFILSAAIICLLVLDPEIFYSEITFGTDYNRLHIVTDWYFYLLLGFFGVISLTYLAYLSLRIKQQKNPGFKKGLRIFQISLSISGVLALIFTLLLITAKPELVWIGPMAVSISVIALYYSIVKYRILRMSGHSAELLSYATLFIIGAVIYVLIFYAIFVFLFRSASPSAQVLALNIIMAAILLCLVPTISITFHTIKSFLPTKKIDLSYIAEKLGRLTSEHPDYKELASFLAMTLKFDFVGLIINGKLYASDKNYITTADLQRLTGLKAPAKGIWQDTANLPANTNIKRVAVLTDPQGNAHSQIVFGRYITKTSPSSQTLTKIEMVLGMAAPLIGKNS